MQPAGFAWAARPTDTGNVPGPPDLPAMRVPPFRRDCQELTTHRPLRSRLDGGTTPRPPLRPRRALPSPNHWKRALSRLERGRYESPANIEKGVCKVGAAQVGGLLTDPTRSICHPILSRPHRLAHALLIRLTRRSLGIAKTAPVGVPSQHR